RFALLLLRLVGVALGRGLLRLVHGLAGLFQCLLPAVGRQLRRLLVELLLLFCNLLHRLLESLLASVAGLLGGVVLSLLRLVGEVALLLGQLLRRLARSLGVALRHLVPGQFLGELLRGVRGLVQLLLRIGWRLRILQRLLGRFHLLGRILLSLLS